MAALGIWLMAAAAAAAQDSAPAPAVAAPNPVVTAGAELDVLSNYVWRGFVYSGRNSTGGPVVWPTAWVSAHGFTASVFGNYDPNWDPGWNEYDLTVTYERSARRWGLGATYTRYVYYNGDDRAATSEVIGRIAYAVGPGELFTTHAFDVESYRGAYYMEAGYGFERELDARSSLSVDASIAFWPSFIDKYTAEGSGYAEHITDGTVGPMALNVSYVRQLRTYVAIRPHVTFVRVGDANARRLLDPPGAVLGVAVVVGK